MWSSNILEFQATNLYAVSSRFGTPDDFKRLVDEAHGYHFSFDSINFHSVTIKAIIDTL